MVGIELLTLHELDVELCVPPENKMNCHILRIFFSHFFNSYFSRRGYGGFYVGEEIPHLFYAKFAS